MMQLDCGPDTPYELKADDVSSLFDGKVNETKELMFAKKSRLWRSLAGHEDQLVNRLDTNEIT